MAEVERPIPEAFKDHARVYAPVIEITNRGIGFWNPPFPLGNFSPHEVEYPLGSGMLFKTAEHAYQTISIDSEEYSDVATAVMSAETPDAAREIVVENEVARRKDWNQVKVDMIFDIMRAKVMQNEEVEKVLIATYPMRLYESEPNDTFGGFWGIMPDGTGINWIGRILMEIREELLFDTKFPNFGSISKNKETLLNLAKFFGLVQEGELSWYRIEARIILRRAELLGVNSEGFTAREVLQRIEEVYLFDAASEYEVQIEEGVLHEEVWSLIEGEHERRRKGKKVGKVGDRKRMNTARFLQLNKYTATWGEINTELKALGLSEIIIEP